MAADDLENSKEAKVSSFSTRVSRTGNLPKFKAPDISRVNRPYLLRLLAVVLIILAIGFGGGWLGARTYNHSQPIPSSTEAKQQYVSSEGQLISEIAKNVGSSVVSIDAVQTQTSQDIFGYSFPQSQEAAGTGFIISSDGTIVTNRHVVPSGTTSVSVTLADGTTYKNVSVIGRTSDSSPLDVAFLKINNLGSKKLTPVTLGNSSQTQVGDRVVAIGNALGQFQNTVTSGIISGYGRDVQAGDQNGTSGENLTDLFQTDAAINEGNSGGPLVNINGDVIAINTAVASGAQNIGFAIPINDVKGLISGVLGSGKLQQPYLGVRYVSLTPDIAYQYNLPVNHGAYVTPNTDSTPSVIASSPAEKAGVKEKDIITKINNININEKTSLTSALTNFKVGDTVTLTVVRDGKTITLHAKLTAAP
ncbi:MAG TPA: trypsin-like peptidase domain-containing protein [Candidatus Saccharimonadales bacterium]|nr:trypsin-like peptidase domain-containing protein [Candidatus Saccharimonadales bacterium]